MKRKFVVTVLALLMVMGAAFAQGTQEGTVYGAASGTPKYVFMFIGDGMALPQTNAAQILTGSNVPGQIELDPLVYTQFPVLGIQYTQDSTSFCPDSASTATSLSSGYKTHSGVIGMGPDRKTAGKSIAEKVKEQLGWKVGIISSVTINHATPAAFYSHVASRNSYYDIGLQMAASGFDYFAGGSVNKAADKGQKSIYTVLAENGYKVTNDRDEILSLQNGEKAYAYAPELQDSGAMKYGIDNREGDLTLADFTRKGIEVLDNANGFFMMVEGGKIDWACHANDAAATIKDVYEFDKAVKVAVDFAKEHPADTLILVTGDHETGGLTIGQATTGYDTAFALIENQTMSYVAFDALIGEMKASNPNLTFEETLTVIKDVFGLVAPGKTAVDPALVMNDYEYAKLTAAFKESMKAASERTTGYEATLLYGGYDPLSVTLTHILNNKAGIGWTSYAHTGVPVPVYAIGAGSSAFSGVYDNTQVGQKLFEVCGVN